MKTLLYIGGAIVVLLAVTLLGGSAGSLPYIGILIVGGLVYLYFR